MSDSEEIRPAIKLPDAMVREARHLARELMQLTEGVMGGERWGSSSKPGFERRIGFALKDTIAFLRDIGGPHE